MRLLLVAYDFPPIPSPQSLRWAYLARELSRSGHDLQVLSPDLPGYGPGGLPVMPESIRVHRVYPGPFTALLASRQRRRPAPPAEGVFAAGTPAGAGTVRPGLNWKGRSAARFKALLGRWMFPDERAEWAPWARRAFDRLLLEFRPDAVITSHEPANSIALGLRAKKRGYRWIADLGDPVLAPYTPQRWRQRAFELERQVCELADVVTVTSEATRILLHERHGLPLARCAVVTQGYDGAVGPGASTGDGIDFDPARLELLYTGSFYRFRRAGALLDSVLSQPGVRLSVATAEPPPEIVEAASAYPEQVRLLGFVPHRQVLDLQRRCDALVNLANDDPVQVPGKLYEYLGAGVPVLHLGAGGDAASVLLQDTGTGVREPNEHSAIVARLAAWQACKAAGEPLLTPVSMRLVEDYRWDRLAKRMADLCRGEAS